MTKHEKYNSVAGAGKTTRLKKTLNQLEGSILFIAFNKSLRDELKHLEYEIPGLSVMTFHAFAKSEVNKLIGPFNPKSEYYHSEIKRMFSLKTKEATAYLQMIKDYTYGALDIDEFVEFAKKSEHYKAYLDLKDSEVERFKYIWLELMNQRLITHDAYFKIYQVNKPTIHADHIIVDEFQDFSDAMADVINNQQQHANIIKAGDDMQRIYEWRGASGKFDIQFHNEENLIKSYRCPPKVVEAVNPYTRFLTGIEMGSHCEHEGEVTVYGNLDAEFKKGNFPLEDCAFIARNNAALFVAADRFLNAGFNIEMDSNLSFEGIKEHWKWLNDYPVNKFLSKFDSKFDKKLIKYYSDTGEEDKISQLACAKTIKDVFAIEEALGYQDPAKPTVRLYTVFKSKGLGFDNVILADDFNSPKGSVGGGKTVLIEEDLKIIYVAMTRAKKKLYIPSSLHFDKNLRFNESVNYILPLPGETLLERQIRERRANQELKDSKKKKRRARNQRDLFREEGKWLKDNGFD